MLLSQDLVQLLLRDRNHILLGLLGRLLRRCGSVDGVGRGRHGLLLSLFHRLRSVQDCRSGLSNHLHRSSLGVHMTNALQRIQLGVVELGDEELGVEEDEVEDGPSGHGVVGEAGEEEASGLLVVEGMVLSPLLVLPLSLLLAVLLGALSLHHHLLLAALHLKHSVVASTVLSALLAPALSVLVSVSALGVQVASLDLSLDLSG